MEYKEVDLSHIVKLRSAENEDDLIFNYNPTKEDIKNAFENDKIIICNCINHKDIDNIIDVIDNIPEDWKHNIAVYCWPMKKEEFEKIIRERLSLKSGPWFAPAGYTRGKITNDAHNNFGKGRFQWEN